MGRCQQQRSCTHGRCRYSAHNSPLPPQIEWKYPHVYSNIHTATVPPDKWSISSRDPLSKSQYFWYPEEATTIFMAKGIRISPILMVAHHRYVNRWAAALHRSFLTPKYLCTDRTRTHSICPWYQSTTIDKWDEECWLTTHWYSSVTDPCILTWNWNLSRFVSIGLKNQSFIDRFLCWVCQFYQWVWLHLM